MPDRNNDLIIVGMLSLVELCNPSLQNLMITADRLFEVLEKVSCGGGLVGLFAFRGAFFESLE